MGRQRRCPSRPLGTPARPILLLLVGLRPPSGAAATEGGVAGTGHSRGVGASARRRLFGECNVSTRQGSIECPEPCPYFLSGDEECKGKCVSADQCRQEGLFLNNATKMCTGCSVPGCVMCGDSQLHCIKCVDYQRLTLDTGETQCVLTVGPTEDAAAVVVVVVMLFAAVYLVALALRRVRNKDVLEAALKERKLSKLRDESIPGMPLYPLCTILMTHPVTGRGVLLFFRHKMALLIWAVLVSVALSCLASIYGLEKGAAEDTEVLCDEDAVAGDATRVQELQRADRAMFWFVVVLYIFSFLGSLVLTVCQRMAFRALDSGSTSMHDFAIVARGFPQEAGQNGGAPGSWGTPPPEQEYREFFEGTLGRRIVGVSVCWNFNKKRNVVANFMSKELAILEWGRGYADELRQERRPCLGSIDNLLCGISAGDSDDEEGADSEEEEEEEEENYFLKPGSYSMSAGLNMATRFATSGYAIVVFHKKEDVEHALRIFGGRSGTEESEDSEEGEDSPQLKPIRRPWHVPEAPATEGRAEPWLQLSSPTYQHGARRMRRGAALGPLFRGRHNIRIKLLPCGPGEVCWENYGKHWVQVSRDVLLAVLGVGLFIVLWLICFYGPYANFVMYASTIAGSASQLTEGLQGTVLGCLITVGNQLVYWVIGQLSQRAGFHYSTHTDNFNVCLYLVAVLINTLLDIFMVACMAHGERLDATFYERNVKTLARAPSAEEILSQQLWSYLFPGTILGPFLVEPLIAFCCFKVSCWVVRSRPGLGRKRAEDILGLPTFEFSRYADNVINVTLCIMFLFYPSSVLFPAFLSLVASIAYIYCWDSYRVLRFTREKEMDLDATENTAQVLLVMPCSVLAMCVVYYLYVQRQLSGLHADSVCSAVLAAGIAHAAMHTGLTLTIQRVLPKVADADEELSHDETYGYLAQREALSWFNANPVHCLRSKYVFRENPPCIYCVKGKEKLLRANEAAGCFFDGAALGRTIDEAALLNEKEMTFLPEKRKRRSGRRRPAE